MSRRTARWIYALAALAAITTSGVMVWLMARPGTGTALVLTGFAVVLAASDALARTADTAFDLED